MASLDAPFEVRRLAASDDRSGFQSGNVEIDRFFQRYAGQNQFRHHIGTTYVAVDEGGFIAGFATVTASELTPPPDKKRPAPYPLPVLRLARLGVDRRASGAGVGSVLVRAVMLLAGRIAEELGCVGVVVDAKPEAVGFYQKLGFVRLEVVAGELGERPTPVPMFLELGQLSP